MGNKELIIYHLHTTLSLLDSTTWFAEYLGEAKKRGLRAIGVSEHGHIFNWAKNMKMCKKNKDKEGDYDIKYLFGMEIYLTETHEGKKVRDNYHTILIAKNLDGARELCKVATMAQTKERRHYNPRISFDEFLGLSNNIIAISACLGGALNKLDEMNPYYDRLVNRYDFLEIQGHNIEDQISYNKKLLALSKKYNKPLIFGTDTHSLDKFGLECRKILMSAKDLPYGQEERLNLTFLTYDEALNMCEIQNAIPMDEYVKALDNTVVLADMVESYKLDDNFKYPDHLYDNPRDKFYKRIRECIKRKRGINALSTRFYDKYLEHIKEEYETLSNQGMQGFLLFLSEMIEWCDSEDIPVGFGRGSVAGSTIAYILGITDVDPIVWNTIFSRFCNSERISLADVDLDFSPHDRPKVYKYIQDRFGDDRTSFIGTVNTVASRGAIDEICRAFRISIDDAKEIKDSYCPLEDQLKVLKKIKKPTVEDMKNIKHIDDKIKSIEEKYPNVFKYYKGVKGAAISMGIHPAGIIASPISLSENIGLMYSATNDCWVSQADMKTVDGLNYVKYDILGLKNIAIIKDAFAYAGLKYPKAHEVNWNDDEVWVDMQKSPIGIFQMEGSFAHGLLRTFNPKCIDDLSLINASMRPSGASYRDKVMNHIPNEGIPDRIFDMLKPTLGYLVYQEQQIAFLQEFCRYSGGKADSVRRMVGKKDEIALTKAVPEIKEAYILNSDKDRDVATKEIEEFAQVFLDACDYSLNTIANVKSL
ncbi:MAG: PHP domain-containing protein [Cetobacterium sp.]|uniref:PHP domain-containing protein n=1 Tax=Cetobacterium sp. TaxID=2071632 RepID=UPI003F41881F